MSHTEPGVDAFLRTVRSKRSAVGYRPAAMRRDGRPAEGAGWEATHKRVTYWMHLDVIRGVRDAAERNGESVAAFVDRALRRELRRAVTRA